MRAVTWIGVMFVCVGVGSARGAEDHVQSTEMENAARGEAWERGFELGAEPMLLAYGAFEEIAAGAAAEDEEDVEKPDPVGYWNGWERGMEVGLNGSSGNTERFNVRASMELVRDTSDFDTLVRLTYAYGRDQGIVTEQKIRGQYRSEWDLDDSPWLVFAEFIYDHDEKQNWKHRISPRGGFGYTFRDDEKVKLVGRVGAAATKNLRGNELAWRPESLFGLDWSWHMTERQKFTLIVDLLPSLAEAGDFRVETRAEYQLLVDPEVNLSLKLGVEDRYDTNPGGTAERNDVDFYAVLVWAF